MGSSCIGFCLLAGFAIAGNNELDHSQKQAVDRQERNQKEADKKLTSFLETYAKETGDLGSDALIPPAFFDKYLAEADAVIVKCNAMLADLDKNGCPESDPRVQTLRQFVTDAKTKVEKFRGDITPKREEMAKLANPKTYPDLDADFERMEDLGKDYSMTNFLSHAEQAKELAQSFPKATSWCSEKFAQYKPLLVLTGGKNGPLYKRYEKTAQSFKKFQTAAQEFVGKCDQEIPQLLDEAIAMAEKAAADKKPAFFTGGVEQKLGEAKARIDVCAGLASDDDSRIKGWRAARDAAKHKIGELAATLEEQIIAETRAPKDSYDGADKSELREKLENAWKEAWPNDEILGIRFHMDAFERNAKWTWADADSAWHKSDMSVLCVTVIVANDSDLATLYPAYVNRDNLSERTSFGVQTKGSEYVIRKMLRDNLK